MGGLSLSSKGTAALFGGTTTPKSVVAKPTSIFTPKVGGTLAGNVLRDLASQYSSGQFGQGNMLRKEGETESDYWARVAQAGGTAANSFNNNVGTGSTSGNALDAFKNGVISDEVKNLLSNNLPKIAMVGIGGYLIYKLLKNNPKGARRK